MGPIGLVGIARGDGMPSTQRIRELYPEAVVGRGADGHPRCDFSLGVRVAFPSTLGSSGRLELLVHPRQEAAWRAFAAVMRTVGYPIREGASGTANCRNINGKSFGDTSLHAHLSAIDLNPSRNTGTASDQPRALQRALAAIRTRRGDQVFRNLADDRMHWQIDCSPASLATGIDPSTVAGGTGPIDTHTKVTVKAERGEAMDKNTWKRVQRSLQVLDPPLYKGKTVDGFPGPDTDRAVKAFEKRVKLTQRGVLGELRKPDSGMWPATRELLFMEALVRRP